MTGRTNHQSLYFPNRLACYSFAAVRPAILLVSLRYAAALHTISKFCPAAGAEWQAGRHAHPQLPVSERRSQGPRIRVVCTCIDRQRSSQWPAKLPAERAVGPYRSRRSCMTKETSRQQSTLPESEGATGLALQCKPQASLVQNDMRSTACRSAGDCMDNQSRMAGLEFATVAQEHSDGAPSEPRRLHTSHVHPAARYGPRAADAAPRTLHLDLGDTQSCQLESGHGHSHCRQAIRCQSQWFQRARRLSSLTPSPEDVPFWIVLNRTRCGTRVQQRRPTVSVPGAHSCTILRAFRFGIVQPKRPSPDRGVSLHLALKSHCPKLAGTGVQHRSRRA